MNPHLDPVISIPCRNHGLQSHPCLHPAHQPRNPQLSCSKPLLVRSDCVIHFPLSVMWKFQFTMTLFLLMSMSRGHFWQQSAFRALPILCIGILNDLQHIYLLSFVWLLFYSISSASYMIPYHKYLTQWQKLTHSKQLYHGVHAHVCVCGGGFTCLDRVHILCIWSPNTIKNTHFLIQYLHLILWSPGKKKSHLKILYGLGQVRISKKHLNY